MDEKLKSQIVAVTQDYEGEGFIFFNAFGSHVHGDFAASSDLALGMSMSRKSSFSKRNDL